jgi:MFS family permease
MMAIGLAMGSGVAGLIVHLIPLLLDAGMTPPWASATASLIGLSSVVSLFIVGPLLDRWNAAIVTAVAISSAIIGLIILLIDPLAGAVTASILIGFCLGAEADALAYLTAKLFGDARYSTIYGWIFGAFTLGYGVSPFCVGLLFDLSGTYTASILFSIVLLSMSMVLCWTLRKAIPSYTGAPIAEAVD